jgi:hypothetical protein
MEKHRQTVSGLLDVIKKYSYENPTLESKLTSEMKLFRNAEGDFGRKSAINGREAMFSSKKTILILSLVVIFFSSLVACLLT